MLSRILFSLFVVTSLCACPGMPTEPEISVCIPELSLNADQSVNWETSQVFCVSDMFPDDPAKQHRIRFANFIVQKPVMTSVEDYSLKAGWGEKLRQWGNKHCKAQ